MDNNKFYLNNQSIIYNNNHLDYHISEQIEITSIDSCDDVLPSLIDKLIVITNHLKKDIINITNVDLTKYHFVNNILKHDAYTIRRFVKVGKYETGLKNNICDVPGVSVGQVSVNDDLYHTGLTVIKPQPGNLFFDKVVASSFAFNGYGKSVGLMQIEEWGTIESNIVFTSTLNVGKVSNAVVGDAINECAKANVNITTFNPVVMECNDGELSKSIDRIHDDALYHEALLNLGDDFTEGAVGAGCGTVCHGYKGGIGSSSRKITLDGKEYTIGVILNSNFGTDGGMDFVFNNRHLSPIKSSEDFVEKGSIIVALATDIPLNERQLKRLLRRIEIGIGRTGSYAGNCSGDVFVGFSTKNRRPQFPKEYLTTCEYVSENVMNDIFKRVPEVVEEAILNSMLYANGVNGYKRIVTPLMDKCSEFIDLLDEKIEWK